MTNRTDLLPGSRVHVYGLTGTVTRVDGNDIHVRLDGEHGRVDIWQRSQVCNLVVTQAVSQ